MNTELTKASKWLMENKLSLNLYKTKVMFYGMGQKLKDVSDSTMNFGTNSIDIVDTYKYPGVMLDSKLKFDKHVNYIQMKICPKLKTLSCIQLYTLDREQQSIYTIA